MTATLYKMFLLFILIHLQVTYQKIKTSTYTLLVFGTYLGLQKHETKTVWQDHVYNTENSTGKNNYTYIIINSEQSIYYTKKTN